MARKKVTKVQNNVRKPKPIPLPASWPWAPPAKVRMCANDDSTAYFIPTMQLTQFNLSLDYLQASVQRQVRHDRLLHRIYPSAPPPAATATTTHGKINPKSLITEEPRVYESGEFCTPPNASAQSLRVYQSQVYGMGLYTMKPVKSQTPIIEYAGQVCGAVVAARRAEIYEPRDPNRPSGGDPGGDYIFTVSAGRNVDATHCGNLARFANHSCEPNSFSVNIKDGRSVAICSGGVQLPAGTEILYDYHFGSNNMDEKIPCACGSQHCKGYLN